MSNLIIKGCLAVLLTGAIVGCGPPDGIRRVVVQGQVKLDGKPIPAGQIMFYPAEATRGPVTIALIQDGKYVANSKGGVPVGRHQVKIEGHRKPTSAPPGMDIEELGREQYLPAKYNTKSELTVDLTEEESSATRDFDLTSN